MGEVISRNSGGDLIFADVRTTQANATAKGGVLKTLADERLPRLISLIDSLEGRRQEAEKVLPPLKAAVEAEDDNADSLIGKVSDNVWNAVGRPGNDPALSILFPGGIAYYANGPDDEQPLRMELLAELLELGLHPRLDQKVAAEAAGQIRASAASYQAAIDALRTPQAKVHLLERVKTALAKAAQAELASLKRSYRAAHLSEAEIHTVIPDRPRPVPAKAPEAPKEAAK